MSELRDEPINLNDNPNATPEELQAARDAGELAAYRDHAAKVKAKYTGLNPLPIWWGFWAIVIGLASISSLFQGQFVAFLLCGAVSFLCAKYTRYLWRGGMNRWFFIIF